MNCPIEFRVSSNRAAYSLEWELRRLCKNAKESLQQCWQEIEELKQKNEASVQEAAELEEQICLMLQILELNLRIDEVSKLSSCRQSEQEIRKRPVHDFFGITHTSAASHKMDDHIVPPSSLTYQGLIPKSMKRLRFSVRDHTRARQEEELKMQLKAMEMDMEVTRRKLQSDIDKNCLACDTLERTSLLQDGAITALQSEILRLNSSKAPKATVLRTQAVSLLKKSTIGKAEFKH